ncbi:MAG: DUF429 domain-containing protein [Pseudomonadota bacterium]
MAVVAGVDGCRNGWVVARWSYDDDVDAGQTEARGTLQLTVVPNVSALLALVPAPATIAIDMPIGLPKVAGPGGRAACVAARKVLGARQSSVFTVPARAAVACTEYREACAVALEHSQPPRAVSKQCFYLFDKIRELDTVMTPALQERVFEVHPEVAFWAMNGGEAVSVAKKVKSRVNPDGMVARRALLAQNAFPIAQADGVETLQEGKGPSAIRAYRDDIIDACACAWSARRLAQGRALSFPDDPPLDERGLRMEIRA